MDKKYIIKKNNKCKKIFLKNILCLLQKLPNIFKCNINLIPMKLKLWFKIYAATSTTNAIEEVRKMV